jgi:hypothetical protein
MNTSLLSDIWNRETIPYYGIIAISVAILVVLCIPTERDIKERQLCDEVVRTVLTTKDQLEFERAAFVVRQLRCSIGRRL